MKTIVFTLIMVFIGLGLFAQVAINTDGSDPDASAMLDVKSTTGGLLIPRMTEQQVMNINNPAQGLLVYDISNNYFVYYDSGKWNILKEGELPRFIIDTDQDTRINVEASADEDKIRFYMEGIEYLVLDKGRINIVNTGQSVFIGEDAGFKDDLTTNENVFIGHNSAYNTINGERNVAIGHNSLFTNDSGDKNTAIGYKALQANKTNDENVAIGAFSLQSNTGAENTAIGTSSMFYNNNGTKNTVAGKNAMYANQNGNSNCGFGYEALYTNTHGQSNVAIGTRALYQNTDRGNLVAIGDSALYKNGTGATESFHATNNTAVGSKALFDNKQGYSNTAIGSRAMINNDDGWKNTAIGAYAMNGNNRGSRNTALGSQALYTNSSGSYNTAVGINTLMQNTESYNTGMGAEALQNNTNGAYNTANGYHALHLNEGGSENTATGANALMKNISGGNTAFGTGALMNNTEGSQNTAIGMNALFSNEGGTQNTAIGFNADVLDNGFTNTTAIGFDAKVGQSNAVTIGNPDVNVGLAGVSNPTEKLEVPGAIKIGNTTNAIPDAGTIRWNQEIGSFEGFDGNEWLSFNGNTSSWGSNPNSIYGNEQVQVPDTNNLEGFGLSIHGNQDYIVIGAPGSDFDKGRAYIYKKSNGTWTLDDILTASDGTAGDGFGSSVSIDRYMTWPVGIAVIVGAPGANSDKGKAYFFNNWDGAGWSEEEIIQPTDLQAGDNFGNSVAMDINYIAIGAKGFGSDYGKVYTYYCVLGYSITFSFHSSIIPADIASNDYFGHSVSIDNNYLIAGAPGYPNSSNTGKAYLYELQNSSWVQLEKFTKNEVDGFGFSVSIADNYYTKIAIGAPFSTVNPKTKAGKVYLYEKEATGFPEQQVLTSENPNSFDYFGHNVSILDEGFLLVGVPYKGSNDNGLAVLFEQTGAIWGQTAKFYPPDYSYQYMGKSVAFGDGDILVGANSDDVGNVFIFSKKPNY